MKTFSPPGVNKWHGLSRWTATCIAQPTLRCHPPLSLPRQSWLLCSSTIRRQMNALQTWSRCGQSLCNFTLPTPFQRCPILPICASSNLHRWFLYCILFYYAGGSYLATTLGGSWSSQVHRGSDEIQVQVRFCALFQLDGASPKMFALGLSTPA